MATLFLALAMVPLIDSILQSSRRAREDRMRVFATALAASALERYRLITPAEAPGQVAASGTDALLNPITAPDSWWDFRDQFQVDVGYAGAGATGVLTARVTWTEGAQTREIELQTLLASTYAPGAP